MQHSCAGLLAPLGNRQDLGMRRMLTAAAVAALSATTIGLALGQHHDPKAHGHDREHVADTRELVHFPTQLAEQMLANMRDHLFALQEIQDALSRGEADKAAGLAEHRLGMTSLSLHGAHEVAQYMPKGMQDAGSGMHRAASQFAILAQDAGVTGDLKPALGALSRVTAQCVGCHAGYRLNH
jgi:hypothetical protein